jgi:nucleotide-binding universal stress UspA family protein
VSRVIVWVAEGTWRACVAEARELLPVEAEVTLVHVEDTVSSEVAAGARAGLLGRQPARRPPDLTTVAGEQARALLETARAEFGRASAVQARRGRPETEIIAVSAEADLLVLARDGAAAGGPKSLAPRTRFVLDHARCAVLLVPGGHDLGATRLPPDPPPLPSQRG